LTPYLADCIANKTNDVGHLDKAPELLRDHSPERLSKSPIIKS
jgi:hypothetical protein